MTIHQARTIKAKEIRTCRKYLARAKGMGLSKKSTPIRYWTEQLNRWRQTSLTVIAGYE